MTATAVASPPEDIFKKHWDTYQVVLAHDYLEHSSLYRALAHFVAVRAGAARLKLLDLGCGDAVPVCKLLDFIKRRDVFAEYHGVDLSNQALSLANANITSATGGSCSVKLTRRDLLNFVKTEQANIDIILLSFSLHHLTQEDKGIFLSHAHSMLKERHGCLCLIDIIRRPGESLDSFHQRQSEDIITWTALGPDGQQALTNHVCTCDLPESIPVYNEMAEAAGFHRVTCLFEAPRELAKFLVFEA